MRYGTHSSYLSHRTFAHACQIPFDVFQTLALSLRHTKYDKYQTQQADAAEQPERAVRTENSQ